MKTLSIKMDSKLYEWLKRQSKLRGCSKSSIICDVLIEYRNEIQAKSASAGMDGFFSGVKDLATNKKHMKGFGEWRQ